MTVYFRTEQHGNGHFTSDVQSDCLASVDRGGLAALVLLDLSATFYTADLEILLKRLIWKFGIDGQVLRLMYSTSMAVPSSEFVVIRTTLME
jgi:hypothetical protein